MSNFFESILTFFLFLILISLGIFIFASPVITYQLVASNFGLDEIILIGTNLLYIVNYFMVVKYLLKFLKSCDTSPFIRDNVKRFKTMGYCLLINSVFELSMGYQSGLGGNIEIMATPSGAVTVPLIICFISALMCFVLAKVFDSAIKIKDENDLTI